MEVSNVAFVNFTGWLEAGAQRVAGMSCSAVRPCYNIAFEGLGLSVGENGTVGGVGARCRFVEEGGVLGVSGDGC